MPNARELLAFLRSRGYVKYVLREFSALPIAVWMLWFLVEISRVSIS